VSVASKVGGAVVVGALLIAVAQYGGSWLSRQPPKAGEPNRDVPVLLVATWQTNREFQMTWTANGRKPPPEADIVSPWEREIRAAPGSTVTFTVRPLIGGPGEHTCQIEQPPGHPLPGGAQRYGGGNTPITCVAVIGA
jgi:hypothetical protein